MASEMFLSQATSTDRLGKAGSPTTLCGVGWRCGNSTLAAVESLWGSLESDQSGVEIEALEKKETCVLKTSKTTRHESAAEYRLVEKKLCICTVDFKFTLYIYIFTKLC